MQSNNEKKCWCHCHCVGMNCPEVLDQTVSHTITVCKHCNAFYEDESCQPQNEAKDIRKAEILMVIKNNLDVLAQVGNDGTTLKETIMNDIKLLIQQPPPMTTHKQSEKECECYKDTSTGWFCPKHLPNGHLASRESTEEKTVQDVLMNHIVDKTKKTVYPINLIPSLEGWEKEFDDFMIQEYGKWKIGRVEAKQFIKSLLLQERQRAADIVNGYIQVSDDAVSKFVNGTFEDIKKEILNPETN